MTASKSASDILSSVLSRRMPALFTRTSTRPNASSALFTMPCAPSADATVSWFAAASPPAARISATTLSAALLTPNAFSIRSWWFS